MLSFFVITIFLFGSSALAAEATSSSEPGRHALASVQEKLKDLQVEVNQIQKELQINEGIHSERVDHLLESLIQAEHSARDASTAIRRPPEPTVGQHAQQHVVNKVVGTILQGFGIYGLLVVLGTISYYCMTGLILSGDFFMVFLSAISGMFSSALLFPPMLLLGISFFGFAHVISIISIEVLVSTINEFGFFMLHPLQLEYVGIVTLVFGAANALLRSVLRKPILF